MNSKGNRQEKSKENTNVDDFSDVQFIKNGTAKKKQSKIDNATKAEVVPGISFFTLYRYASRKDTFFIAAAIILSIICGSTLPLNTILFADLLQDMVDYGKSKITDDVFLRALLEFAIYYLSLGALVVILSYGATVMMNISAYNQVYRIREEYLKAALNQDFEYFDTHKTGDFAAKMTADVINLEDGMGEKLATFIYYQAAFISCIVMALIKGWKLALLCLISLPVTLLLVGLAGLVASRLSKKEAVAAGKAGSVAEEVLSAVRTVYAFSGQHKEVERYETHLKEIRKINIKKGFFNGLAMGALFFCIFCSYAMSFWFGYQLMTDPNENYDVATMIAVFMGVFTGSANFGVASTLMEVFGGATGAGAQIFHLIDNVPIINPLLNRGVTPLSIEGNIELKNVVFHYPSRPDVPVLKGVNISVKRGQSAALVGHSGCGKSTIVQLISRNYDVVSGSVNLDGSDVRDLSVRWLRSQIGLVRQEPVLFNTTVRQNIRYGRDDASDEEIEQAARLANAHQFIIRLPKGYETLVGDRGASLSGGQKQRIAIARALVRNPRILLLDEATSALDTASEDKVQRALDKASDGRTTILVAHRLTTVRNVHVIYVMKSGQVVEIGSHEELMMKKGRYYDMVMLQTTPEVNKLQVNDKSQFIPTEKEKDDKISHPKSEENVKDEEVVPKVSFWHIVRLNALEWKLITFASLCSLLSGLASPIVGIILGDFVGALTNPNEEEVRKQIQIYVFIFMGLGVFASATNFIQVFMYGIAGEYLTDRLRQTMFRTLLKQEIAFYDDQNNSTGALCAKLSGEAAAVQGATGQRIGTVLQAVGTFSFGLILALVFEWRVGLVALAFTPFMAGILYKEGRMVSEDSSGTAKIMEDSSKIAVEAVSNVRTVQSLGREETFRKEYAIQLLPALLIAKRSVHCRGLVFGLSRGIFNFVYAAALYYGGTLVVNAGVDCADILKSSKALLMGSASAAQAFAFAPNFQKGIKAAQRIVVLLKRQSKTADPDVPFKENFYGSGEANFQHVNFRYPSRPLVQVLSDFILEIEQGKTIALVGASGCGKSTVVQLLERYYDPDEGIVAQNGVPLSKLRLWDVRRSMGLVQQEPVLFDRTIGENIAYGDNSRAPSVDEIVDAAKQANIHNFVTSLPLGYDTNIGSKGTQLSGGQKQRVAIARALIRRPNMLLLDEATSALDTKSEQVVQEALDKAKTGRTCIMIAHRMSTIRDADLICVISEGRVAERGTHQQLMELSGIYYNLNSRRYS